MPVQFPKVTIVKAITPAAESMRADLLKYEHLASTTSSQERFTTERTECFFNTEIDSLEELGLAQQLAMHYLLMTAVKLNTESSYRGSQNLWSKRYTQASSEIYGTPESEIARNLARDQLKRLTESASTTVSPNLVEQFTNLNERYGIRASEDELAKDSFELIGEEVAEYLQIKYESVFNALELENVETKIEPEDVARRFRQGLEVLAEQYDPAWYEWEVVIDQQRDTIIADPANKNIVVGAKRASLTPEQLKGLFAHEVLVHGLRCVNGTKYSEQLGTGLPQYLDAEEGLGVFFEYAISGSVPEKNVDRYVDIALALGLIDQIPKPRSEMLEYVRTRAYVRNELAAHENRKTLEQIENEVYAHVNRIYRGSLGNEYIGILTKDIAYQVGFIKIGVYIQNQRSRGVGMSDIMEYLLSGKFDPTNAAHVTEAKKHVQ